LTPKRDSSDDQTLDFHTHQQKLSQNPYLFGSDILDFGRLGFYAIHSVRCFVLDVLDERGRFITHNAGCCGCGIGNVLGTALGMLQRIASLR
jgi:hypothetical protein